jgi:hypothetical protein
LRIQSDTLERLAASNTDLAIESGDVTVTIPSEALAGIAAEQGGVFHIDIASVETETGLASVEISIASSGGNAVTDLAAPVSVSVNIGELEADVNPHRIVATLDDGTIVGGSYDAATGTFTFETTVSGEFTISYVENMNRLSLQIGSNQLVDLAGNAAAQTMDVPPIIENGRTLLPIRFMANALGADVNWNEATREVSLTLNGATLTFGVDGQLSPQLAALGMDVPAQIVDGRTMVPLRFISEYFGAHVSWDESTQSIEIISI